MVEDTLLGPLDGVDAQRAVPLLRLDVGLRKLLHVLSPTKMTANDFLLNDIIICMPVYD